MFTASVFGAKKETVQQQTYTPQVMINTPWGEKNVQMDREQSPPGEFGLCVEGPIMGPSTFTIAPNGDVYIVDTFNHRIQKFSKDGAFVSILPAHGSGWAEDIAVDENGNIYLFFSGTSTSVAK